MEWAGVRAHPLDGGGRGNVEAVGILSQAQVAVAEGTAGPGAAHHLKELQAQQARHSRCGGGNGWDDLAHDPLALPTTGDWVWDGCGPGVGPPRWGLAGRVTWARVAAGIP